MKKTVLIALFSLAAGVLLGASDWGKDIQQARKLTAEGKYEEARTLYKEILTLPQAEHSNSKREILTQIGSTWILEKKAEEAKKTIDEINELKTGIHPNTTAEGYILEGRYYTLTGKYDEAETFFQKVISNEHQHELFKSKAELYRGYMFLAQNKKEEAKAAFEAVGKYTKTFGEVKKDAEAQLAELNKK